jgi:hypothetical protein
MPCYALIDKLSGYLLSVDTSTEALSSTAMDRTADSISQVFDIRTSQGSNNFTIKEPSKNNYLSHFDGSYVDFNSTSEGSAYTDRTAIM